MNSSEYLVLNSWLQKADQNYISGRCLWFNRLTTGACNLLWLSIEQMIKILILQKRTDDSSEKKDLDELHKELNEDAKRIGHNLEKLIRIINKKYEQINISNYEEMLKKIQEYFYRRYVVHKGSSISLLLINQIDELYFLLRSLVDLDVGLGIIDEIFIQKKWKSGHPLESFQYAYFNNKFFKSRKHREICYLNPDGTTFKEDGT